MFSNGSEYDSFLEENCLECPFSRENNAKTMCEVDQRIGECQWMDTKEAVENFPYEWMTKNGRMSRFDCRKKQGKKLRFWTTDELPSYDTTPMTEEQIEKLVDAISLKE